MNDDENISGDIPNESLFSVPIPKIFHSFELGSPFSKCSVCGKNLLTSPDAYFIEKAFRGEEVIFEYAMCDSCREGMGGELSEESMENLSIFFTEQINMIERIEMLFEQFDNSVKPWLDRCLVTGKPRKECEGYQICAQCQNDQLLVALGPMMISSEATEQLQALLSKKTQEGFDGFIKDTLNPPVDFQDIPLLV